MNRESESAYEGAYSGYSDSYRPLGGYVGVLAVFAGAALGYALVASRKRERLADDISVKDLALIGVATHKASRIISKDEVTSPIRAPFARFEGSSGASEVDESTRGKGMRRAVGDLLTCPWCIGTWVAGAFMASYSFWPRPTRFVAAWLSTVAVSDSLNHVYAKTKSLSE